MYNCSLYHIVNTLHHRVNASVQCDCITNQNRLSAYFGFLCYFLKPQSYVLFWSHIMCKEVVHGVASYLYMCTVVDKNH